MEATKGSNLKHAALMKRHRTVPHIIEREFLRVRMTCRLWVIMMESGSCVAITQDSLRQLVANIPFCELVRRRLALNRHTSN